MKHTQVYESQFKIKYVLRLGSTTSTSFIQDSIGAIMRLKEKVGKGRRITSY